MWKGVPKKWKGLALSPPQLDPLLISHMHLAYLVFTDSEVIEPVVFQTPVQSLKIMEQMQMYWESLYLVLKTIGVSSSQKPLIWEAIFL